MEMVQNVLLVVFCNETDETKINFNEMMIQLRIIVSAIKRFKNFEQFIEFIKKTDNEKLCILLPSNTSQQIMPYIHNVSQVQSIFIFGENRAYHEQLTVHWPKIKGIFIEIESLCKAIKHHITMLERNCITFNVLPVHRTNSVKNFDELISRFMFAQVLKELLLRVTFNETEFLNFIYYCREKLSGNEVEMKNIDKMETKYHQETPIWWYRYECFLYRMLNRALCLLDIDVIIKLAFFISDLHHTIEKQHKKQFSGQKILENFTIYRGQGMSKIDFDQIVESKGGLLSFNNFLSTRKSSAFVNNPIENAASNPDMVGVLFVMNIDPSMSISPFTSIHDVSVNKNEEEVIFSINTIFRIRDISSMSDDRRRFRVELSFANGNDNDVRTLMKRIQEETYPHVQGWERIGLLLFNLNQPQKAEQIYKSLFNHANGENEKASIYNQLGEIKYNQGQFNEAIKFYKNSLDIKKKHLSHLDHDLAATYNNIGLTYSKLGEFSKASSCWEKELEIEQQSLPSDHPSLALCYNNLGNAYKNMGDYSKALSCHKKAIDIRKQSLSSNHPDLATSYNSIGLVYCKIGDYTNALLSHQKALDIQKQSLPSMHPDFVLSYSNIANVYSNIGEYAKALSFHEQALEIQMQSLSPTDPNVALTYNSIGCVYSNMRQHSKALLYYEKALRIQKESLSTTHPDIASSYNNIGNAYKNLGNYSNALDSHEKALAIRQQLFRSTHPDLAMSQNNIGLVYHKMNDFSRARSHFKRAVSIGQQTLPVNHPNLQRYQKNLEEVKQTCCIS